MDEISKIQKPKFNNFLIEKNEKIKKCNHSSIDDNI